MAKLRDFEKLSAGVIAILGLAVGLHFFFVYRGFYSISWDEAGRTLDAYHWVNHGTVQGKAWLPFYRVCVGLALKVFPDLIVTPRVIVFFFGLAAIVACGWLAWELFQNRRIAWLTLALAALFPQRIALTLAPLSDMIFIPMILVAGALLARALRVRRRSVLLWCGLLGALATMVRYEGWVFVAFLFIAAGISGVRHKDLLLFGGILFLFPAIWLLATFGTTNPVDTVVRDGHPFSLMDILRKNPAAEFVYMNLRCLNLIGLVPIVGILWRRERHSCAMVIAFFAPLLVASTILLSIHTAQTGPSWRMISVWSLLLLPFTAYLVGTAQPFARLLLIPLLFGAFGWEIFRIERQSFWAFPAYSRQAGEYLKGRIASNPGTKILIDSTTFAYLNIQVASQSPDAFLISGTAIPPSLPSDIRFFAIQNEVKKQALARMVGIRKLAQFGPWSIYESPGKR